MLSSPLMMNHVRSYYQNQNIDILKTKNVEESQNKGLNNDIKLHNDRLLRNNKIKKKYITRTRNTSSKSKNIKKRTYQEFKNNQDTASEMKLVLTKGNQNKMSLRKFSLKRVSQI